MDPAADKTPVLMVGPSQLTNGIDRGLALEGETFKNLIIDQATIFIHKEKLHILLPLIEDGLTIVLKRFHWMKERLVGFSGKVAVPDDYIWRSRQGFCSCPKAGRWSCNYGGGIDHIYTLHSWIEGIPMRKMKNNPLHLDMMPTLETFPGIKIITIESQTEKKQPCLFTNKLISLLELGKERATGESENKVQLVPKKSGREDDSTSPRQTWVQAQCLLSFYVWFLVLSLFWCFCMLPLLVILRQILSVSISFADSPLLLEVAQQHSQITRWESRFEEELMCKQSNPLAGAVTKKLLPIKPKKNHEAKEIMRATNYFASNHVLSSGGNGEVYWGILDGTQVAVKRPYQAAHTVRCRDHIFHELKILGQGHMVERAQARLDMIKGIAGCAGPSSRLVGTTEALPGMANCVNRSYFVHFDHFTAPM
ncbi:hypothetical protein MRB53_035398 [Persea americana]|uniref:Uncharacterized protein n=1 Tax=Persea americana TaxID=3435 RepID=A0ACC2K4Q8_PERAE|nr:hypothetical protein MRB53_035398 [Persea americana]